MNERRIVGSDCSENCWKAVALRNFRKHAIAVPVCDKDTARCWRVFVPQYPVVARTEAHVVHASCSSDVIDVSCKKRRR